jgi:hypothetical protein
MKRLFGFSIVVLALTAGSVAALAGSKALAVVYSAAMFPGHTVHAFGVPPARFGRDGSFSSGSMRGTYTLSGGGFCVKLPGKSPWCSRVSGGKIVSHNGSSHQILSVD